jgi:hypothetical protein
MGVMYSDFGSRRAMEYHQDKLFDIDMGEILASKRNKLIENQYNIHGTELEKKAARETYKGQIGGILFESAGFVASMEKTKDPKDDTGGIERYPGEYGGGKTQSGGGMGTTGQAGQQASAGAPGTQSGKAVARKADTRR